MACSGCGGAFYRQLDTVVVSISDTSEQVVPIEPPMIAFSWWQVGKRLVFEVPVSGIMQSDTTLGIRFRDHTAAANLNIASLVALAGSESESFRLICDVSEVANSTITLKCFMDYPFVVGLDPAPTIFSTVSFNTNFHPLEPQIYLSQSEALDAEITFQNIQFTGMPKTALLVC